MQTDSLKKVRSILAEKGSVTKPELSQLTGLTTAACGYILNSLVESGEVLAENFRSSSGGRPAMAYRFNAARFQFLCLYALYENGKESLHYRICDILGNISAGGEFKEKNLSAKTIARRISKLQKRHTSLCAVAIGIQGGVSNGVVEFSDFKNLDGVDLATEIFQKTGLLTLVENDMNSIALGFSQKNFGEKNVAILFVPKGNPPAGGFLVEGDILRGSSNLAGELSDYPFAFERSAQQKIFSSIETAWPPIRQILLSTIAFLDPAVIVFTGGFAEELSQKKMEIQIRKFLRRPHLPTIAFLPNPQEEYFGGLFKMAKERFLESVS